MDMCSWITATDLHKIYEIHVYMELFVFPVKKEDIDRSDYGIVKSRKMSPKKKVSFEREILGSKFQSKRRHRIVQNSDHKAMKQKTSMLFDAFIW